MDAQLNSFNSVVLVCNMDETEGDLRHRLKSLRIDKHHNTCIWVAAGSDGLEGSETTSAALVSLRKQAGESPELNHIVWSELFSFDVLTKLSQDFYVTRVEHIGFD